MPHFLINSTQISDDTVIINDKNLYKHIINVMRMRIGERLLFLDENEIQYETTLCKIKNNSFSAKIEKYYKSQRKLPLKLYAAQSVLSSDNQISAIKKAAELGVKGIIPLYTDNCAVKQSVIKTKIEKWQKIALEAVKQCERADIPSVFEMSYIIDVIKNYDEVIVFAEKYADKNFFEYLRENPIDKNNSILVIIGPEGGFSEGEFEFFKENKIPLITLGNLIYRADTALTAALTTVINGVLYGNY